MWQTANANNNNISIQAYQGVQQLVTAHRELQQRFLQLEQKVFTMNNETSANDSEPKSESVENADSAEKTTLTFNGWINFVNGLEESQKSKKFHGNKRDR